MNFYNKTVLGLFDSSQKHFIIPVYQRAYSWEKEQWKAFLDDLKEQIEGENNYFYGNILLETIQKDVKYEVIDGQQRLTTLSIFIRSLLNVLQERQTETAEEQTLSDFSIESKVAIFLKNNGNIKLRPVDYDRACYDALIIDDQQDFPISTPSQARIKEAKLYFIHELKQLSTEKILKILSKLESTELTTIELKGKKDSALMFELENNRGKDLTNMEKIKSYFMYQMYIYSSSDQAETNIENISNIFKDIYKIINNLKINEDSVLIYHNNAYINGYTYRTLDDVKKKFKDTDTNKVKWIKEYITELHTSFSNMERFEKSHLNYAKKLTRINIPAYIYPFIIKGYKHFGNDDKKLNALFHILEIVAFRSRLINSRANIQERLNPILNSFNGNLQNLRNSIKNKLNQTWYWGDENAKTYLNSSIYGNKIVNYILWEYEDSLQDKGYQIENISLTNEQIEHISPQTPADNDSIATGYEVTENGNYSDDFLEHHLHTLGNLLLISQQHNASIGNKPFHEKLASYQKNPWLKQQTEIAHFATIQDQVTTWKTSSIEARQEVIVKFALNRWSFDSIDLSHLTN